MWFVLSVNGSAWTSVFIPWVVKLKREGFSLPLGSLTLGSRSSSKKECAQASRGVRRAVGVYSSRREHRAMASGGVRGRNTWTPVRRKDRCQNRDVWCIFYCCQDIPHTHTHTAQGLKWSKCSVTCNTMKVYEWMNEWMNEWMGLLQQWTVVNWLQLQRATTAGSPITSQEKLLQPADWMTLLSNGTAVGGTAEGEPGREKVSESFTDRLILNIS